MCDHIVCKKATLFFSKNSSDLQFVANSSKCSPYFTLDDLNDRYSNPVLNACINRHAHTEYLKMIRFYSPLGILHIFL